MPTYDFKCGYCEVTTEVFFKFDDVIKVPECPKCEKEMSRIYNAAAIQFKGSGFYKTDNK